MTVLRIAHRFCAVTAIAFGAALIVDGFTDGSVPTVPAVMWMSSTAGVIAADRRMKTLVRRHRNDDRPTPSEENR